MANYLVGLTGGIAAGKTALCTCFQQLKVPIIDADDIARTLIQPGPILDQIVNHFGVEILDAHGHLQRRQLREIIFTRPAERQVLESIMHPAIQVELREQASRTTSKYSLIVIPLLTSLNRATHYDWLDRVLTVTAPIQIRRERLCARDGISADFSEQMIQSQVDDENRRQIADDFVVNDGPLGQLWHDARYLHQLYLQLAQQKSCLRSMPDQPQRGS